MTDHTPKPLLDLHGRPLIVHQLAWLKRAGIAEVVINLHHLGDQIQAAVGNGMDLGVSIRYSHEADLLETGGGIKQALPLLGEDPFVVLNGDIWTDFNFDTLPDELGTDLAHLVLVDKPAHREEGDFDLDGDRVLREGHRRMVYCGIALLSPALFTGARDGAFSLRDLLFSAADARHVGGQRFTGHWIDIGSPDQLDAARRLTGPGTNDRD